MFTRFVAFSLLLLTVFVGCGKNNNPTASSQNLNQVALVELANGNFVPLACAQEAHILGVMAADHCAGQEVAPPASSATSSKVAVSPGQHQYCAPIYYNYYNYYGTYNTLYLGYCPRYYNLNSFCGSFGFGYNNAYGNNCYQTLGYGQNYYPSSYNPSCNNFSYNYSQGPWYQQYSYQYANQGCYSNFWGI